MCYRIGLGLGGVVLVMFVRGVGSGEGTGEPASSPGESEGFPF